MADFNVASQIQPFQAPNVLGVAEHVQKMQTSNMLMRQRAAELQKENALTQILGRSDGKASPDVIKSLIASGNYEPALALQRHAASMGAMGVQTQAAQTALEKARLDLGETKRTLSAGAAARDFISGNDELTNPDALKKLRQVNPDAYEAITKFNGLTAKMTYEASTAKRLDDKAKLDLMQGTASVFAPAFATAQTDDQYRKLYDKLAAVYPDINAIATREFTPENVKNIVQTGASAHDLEAITIGGRPAIRNKRTGMIQLSETGTLGANAAAQPPMAAAPTAVAGGPSPMAPTVDNALALSQPSVTPGVNALAPRAAHVAQPTVQQLLAEEQTAKETPKNYRLGANGAYEPIPGGPADPTVIESTQAATTRGLETSKASVSQETAKTAKKETGQYLLRTLGGEGTDKIENLIKASTSGFVQRMGAEAVGAFGTATSGMTNIATLGHIAKQMTFDLLNGKLGAGISNADRDFIMGLSADIANPNIPANERIAGLRQLKNTMEAWANGKNIEISAPVIEPESNVPREKRGTLNAQPTVKAPSSAKAPAGVPQNVWDVMTPQERALF